MNASMSYIPPLQKHIKGNEMVAMTIKVRVFQGDTEQDVMCKFTESPALYPEQVIAYLCDKIQVPSEYRCEFGLWIMGKDLELQLRPGQCIVSFMKNWHRWAEKYTHYPECKNPAHNINMHYFILRREALSDVREKRTEDMPSTVVALLYGEAKHYVLDSRYITHVEDIISLAGLQMQIVSEYDPFKHTGYIAKSDRWLYMVPAAKRKSLKPAVWIDRITESWKKLKGVTSEGARIRYLNYVKKWPFYGHSFFPCCEILPPGGYFEMRTQHWLFGVGLDGITIIDTDKAKLVLYEPWTTLLWEFGEDNLKVWYSVNGKQKSMQLMTPQAVIIKNIIQRAVHLAVKNGVQMAPVERKNKNKGGFSVAGKALNRVGDTGGSRFDEIRKQRVDAAKTAKNSANIQDNAVVVNED